MKRNQWRPWLSVIAGGILLVQTARGCGLERALSAGLQRWRLPLAVHDPGKIVLDLSIAVALGGACAADIAVVRAQPEVFGAMASDPTVSRLVARLATEVDPVLAALREQANLARIPERCQALRIVEQLVSDFGGMLRQRHGQHLDTWTPGLVRLRPTISHRSKGSPPGCSLGAALTCSHSCRELRGRSAMPD